MDSIQLRDAIFTAYERGGGCGHDIGGEPLDEITKAMEDIIAPLEAECNRRAPQTPEQVRAIVDEWNEKNKALAVSLDAARAYGKAQEEKANMLHNLLRRYIQHVRHAEGVDYITGGSHHQDDYFSPEEWAVLRELAK